MTKVDKLTNGRTVCHAKVQLVYLGLSMKWHSGVLHKSCLHYLPYIQTGIL